MVPARATLPASSGVSAHERHLLVGWRPAQGRHHGVVQRGNGRKRLCRIGLPRDPGRVLEDRPERLRKRRAVGGVKLVEGDAEWRSYQDLSPSFQEVCADSKKNYRRGRRALTTYFYGTACPMEMVRSR